MEKSERHDAHHASGTTVYFVVFGLLMLLLAATVGASMLHLGVWSVTVALLIAFAKAALIVLYFMHVHEERGLIAVFSVAGFLWLGLLFVFTFSDYLTRGTVARLDQ
jgi:cytochrome c oxidase subunit IV